MDQVPTIKSDLRTLPLYKNCIHIVVCSVHRVVENTNLIYTGPSVTLQIWNLLLYQRPYSMDSLLRQPNFGISKLLPATPLMMSKSEVWMEKRNVKSARLRIQTPPFSRLSTTGIDRTKAMVSSVSIDFTLPPEAKRSYVVDLCG